MNSSRSTWVFSELNDEKNPHTTELRLYQLHTMNQHFLSGNFDHVKLFYFQVVYVTALLPYLILTIILIRALMLEGSVDGIMKYLTPDFSKLRSFQVSTTCNKGADSDIN